MLWQWQATMHLNGKGYKATLEGENRDDATSSDATVRDEYVRKNGDLFREILRMLNAKSEAGKTLMLQIQDEFDNDHDGYGLWEYLKAWASSLTPAEVKVLKKRVEALKFSASETPEKWSYKMQLLLNMWKRIPADKRGGTIADLSDTLLDKVLEVPSCKSYTQYVKAFMDATNGDMTDYQGIVKLLVEQHRQQCAAGGLSGQSGGRGDNDARRGIISPSSDRRAMPVYVAMNSMASVPYRYLGFLITGPALPPQPKHPPHGHCRSRPSRSARRLKWYVNHLYSRQPGGAVETHSIGTSSTAR